MSKKSFTPELEIAIAEIKTTGWRLDENERSIHKTFKFKTFADAFSWMTRVAFAAEKLNHHPDWANSYNKVHVVLTTHSTEGVTELDIRLAQAIDKA